MHQDMIATSESRSKTVDASLGKHRRSSSFGSLRSNGPILSMEMELFPVLEDIKLDGSLGLSSDEIMIRLKSADLFDDILLPDTAMTAFAAQKAEQPSATSNEELLSQQQQDEKMVKLTFKFGRISTGDEIVSLNENIRVSSSDWPPEMSAQSSDAVPMHPFLLFDMEPFASRDPSTCMLDPNSSPTGRPSAKKSELGNQPPVTALKIDKKKPPVGKKTKRRKPRLLDMTRAVKKTDKDVLFGRGTSNNIHPGNIEFRKKAQVFLPWYIRSSKEEKEKIANILIESVKSDGCRFLEKSPKDGLWYEVIRGEHTKACATFRDLKEGKNKKKSSLET